MLMILFLQGRLNKRIKEVKDAIAEKFMVKDVGELHHFLGIKLVHKERQEEYLDWPRKICKRID